MCQEGPRGDTWLFAVREAAEIKRLLSQRERSQGGRGPGSRLGRCSGAPPGTVAPGGPAAGCGGRRRRPPAPALHPVIREPIGSRAPRSGREGPGYRPPAVGPRHAVATRLRVNLVVPGGLGGRGWDPDPDGGRGRDNRIKGRERRGRSQQGARGWVGGRGRGGGSEEVEPEMGFQTPGGEGALRAWGPPHSKEAREGTAPRPAPSPPRATQTPPAQPGAGPAGTLGPGRRRLAGAVGQGIPAPCHPSQTCHPGMRSSPALPLPEAPAAPAPLRAPLGAPPFPWPPAPLPLRLGGPLVGPRPRGPQCCAPTSALGALASSSGAPGVLTGCLREGVPSRRSPGVRRRQAARLGRRQRNHHFLFFF